MKSRSSSVLSKSNFYDGQKVTEADLDAEQLYNQSVASGIINDFHGSGIVRESIFESNVLFDSLIPGEYSTDSDPNLSKEVIDLGNYDGVPIKVDLQPSDLDFGNRLEVELINADVAGRVETKVLIIGFAFSSLSARGQLVCEVLSFQKNQVLLSKYFYKEILSIVFNNFSGGTGKTEFSSTKDSIDVISANSGHLIIRESEALKIFPKSVIADQIESPNIDLSNFITGDINTSIEDVLKEAIGDDVNFSDLYFELSSALQVSFEKNGNVTKSFGQKFLSEGNNLQRIDLLLSVDTDSSLPVDEQLDFSGELVLSIHKLQTDTNCSSDLVPDRLLDFDPEIDPIMEISLSQSDLAVLGYVLSNTPQVVSFNFASTLLADPNIDPSIESGEYYAFLLSRRGDTRTGTLNLEVGWDIPTRKVQNGQTLTPEEKFLKQQSRYFEFDTSTKRYVDNSSYSLWHKVFSDCIEITPGTAYSDDSHLITIPKTQDFVGDTKIANYIDGIPLVNVAYGAANYVTLAHIQSFISPVTHPRTGNLVYSRIFDTGEVAVYNDISFQDIVADNPLVLAKVSDKNIRSASKITKDISSPGTFERNVITIINPSSDLLTTNLIDRILTPDLTCECNAKYRIIKTECETHIVGDINDDEVIDSLDITEIIDLLGNTINSAATELAIASGSLDVVKFRQADLNGDDTVDGTDLEILEDAVDGYVNFSVPEKFRVLKIHVENIFESDDYPFVLNDNLILATTGADSNTVSFTVTDYKTALAIRVNDSVSISGSNDIGSFLVLTKTLDATGLIVSLTVSNPDGTEISFIGEGSIPFSITSGTATNMFADNLGLLELPFSESQFSIDFIEAPFKQEYVDVCDLRRYVSRTFIDERVENACSVVTDLCDNSESCTPALKNQQYFSGDVYIPDGEIYQSPGIPYHGDFEYATVSIALPPGSIDDCQVNLYDAFLKAESGSALTAAGYPAMKYSDGTFVGCQDDGSDNDIAKGRVKFSSAIASLYVDSLISGPVPDGYVDGSLDGTSTTTAANIVTENFTDQTFIEFSDWSAEAVTDTGIFSVVLGASLINSFSTLYVSDTERFGQYSPNTFADLTGDLLIDFTMARYIWDATSPLGGVYSALRFDVSNTDGTTAILRFGWKQYSTNDVKLFFAGTIKDSGGITTSSFEESIDVPDSVGDDILFRVKRVDDVFFAYYINPTSISEVVDFGQFIRIGTNPTTQPGSGPVAISFESKVETFTTAGLDYQVVLKDLTARSEYLTEALSGSEFSLSRSVSSSEIERVAISVPIDITPKTSIISATLTFITASATIATDSFNIIPLQIVNANNLVPWYNYPYIQDNSVLTNFMPGVLSSGATFEVDVTNIVIKYLSDPGFLPGYYKAFVIEPDSDNSSNSSVLLSNEISLDIAYEELTTGVIFKIGISIDAATGIASFKTKNILYDALNPQNRTTIKFGVYLKKSSFRNQDISLGITELKKIGLGSCYDPDLIVSEDEQCYFVVSTTGVGTFVEGPFDCAFSMP